MRIKNIISSIENYHLINCVIFIFVWIFLRIFFEGVLEVFHTIGFSKLSYRAILMYFVHFPLFYLTSYLLITILISIIIRKDIIKVTKITSLGLGLIIFVPVIDAFICGGCFITYPSRLEKYFLHFLNPSVSLIDIGVSIGQRIVILGICFLVSIYGYLKTGKILKTIFLFFAILLTILFMGSITTMLAGNQPERVFISGGILNTDTQKFSAIYSIIFIIAIFIYFYLVDKKNFRLFISSLRIERMAFYGFLGIAGFVLAQHRAGIIHRLDFFNLLAILLIFLSPGIGFCALQILNDFFDVQADAVSKPRNPLVSSIWKKYYIVIGSSLALIVLMFSAILNYQAFLIMLSFFLLGILYSVPPVRLKRLPLISTFVLAFAVVLSIGLGFSGVYYEKALNQIPLPLFYALLFGVTLGFTAKDINDTDADKKDGIITLPVLLYKNDTVMGRLPLGLIISSGYIFFAIFIPEVLLGSLIASVITFIYTLLTTRPREWFYFLILYFFAFYLLATLRLP